MRFVELRFVAALGAAAFALCACPGGSKSSLPMQSQSATAGSTLTFTIPAPTQSVQRGSKVIPSGTTSILIGYQGQVGSLPPTFIGGSPAPSTIVIVATVNVPSSACFLQSNGAYICTVTVTFPVGVLDIYIEAFGGPNGTGTLLASSLTVAQINPSGALTAPGTNTPITVTSPTALPVPPAQPPAAAVSVSPNFLSFVSSGQSLSVQAAQTGNVTFIAGPIECSPSPGQFRVVANNNVFQITNLNPVATFTSCSMRINGTGGLSNVVTIVVGAKTFAGTITEFSTTGPSQPQCITSGPDGNVWFTENNTDKVGRITPGGTIAEFSVTGGSVPDGITAGPDGNLWFTEVFGNRIGRMTTSGTFVEFAIPTVGSGPFGITMGADGNLWFTEIAGNKIGRITPGGTIAEFAIPTGGSAPFGITTGPDGNVWFAEQNTSNVGRITPTGAITEFTSPTANAFPFGITTGPDGNLWFTELGPNKIGRVTPGGTFAEFVTPGTPLLITSGPDGNIWFTDVGTNEVGRLQ